MGSGGDYFNSIIQTFDGGYLVCGKTNSSDGDLNGIMSGEKAWIVKLNSLGNISWQRHYLQEPIYNCFNDIVQNSDGSCIAVGYLNHYADYDDYDVFAVKLDVNSLSNAEFNNGDLVLYPNAVDNILNIQSNGEIFKEITIYDIQGKKVNSFLAENNSVNLSSLQKGVYFVAVKNELNQSIRKKIVKN